MRRSFRGGLSVVLGLALATSLIQTQGAAQAATQPCSNGLVALTYDDGPSPLITPKLLNVFAAKRVRATLFVSGARVAERPDIVSRAYASGMVIGNHTYNHHALPTLTDEQIVEELQMTADAITSAGAVPSNLMRPPYGAYDARVLGVIQGYGLVPVLWNVDPEDWNGPTTEQIVHRVLAQLVPWRDNIVLLHDGNIGYSAWETLAAMPMIIDRARARGYCFAVIGPDGRPAPPVPAGRVRDARVLERDAGAVSALRFVVRLSEPTSRPTSVRIHTRNRTALAGRDYIATDHRIRFPIGVTRKVVKLRVLGDNRNEPTESLKLILSQPSGMRIADRAGIGWIVDNDG